MAGYPSMTQLAGILRAESDDGIPDGLSLAATIQHFIDANGKGALMEIMSDQFSGQVRAPTRFHHAMARLAARDRFAGIVTTALDPLVEYTLHQYGVAHDLQVIEHNSTLGKDVLRVLKVNGSYVDWLGAIATYDPAEVFDAQHPFLARQLDVELQQRSVLLVGSSMTDARLLNWLGSRNTRMSEMLNRWRPMMTQASWERALATPWREQTAAYPLGRGNIRPLLVRDYEQHLLELWTEVADRLGAEFKEELAWAEDIRPLPPTRPDSTGDTVTASEPQEVGEHLRGMRAKLRILIALSLVVVMGVALAAYIGLNRSDRDSTASPASSNSPPSAESAARPQLSETAQISQLAQQAGEAAEKEDWNRVIELTTAALKIQPHHRVMQEIYDAARDEPEHKKRFQELQDAGDREDYRTLERLLGEIPRSSSYHERAHKDVEARKQEYGEKVRKRAEALLSADDCAGLDSFKEEVRDAWRRGAAAIADISCKDSQNGGLGSGPVAYNRVLNLSKRAFVRKQYDVALGYCADALRVAPGDMTAAMWCGKAACFKPDVALANRYVPMLDKVGRREVKTACKQAGTRGLSAE